MAYERKTVDIVISDELRDILAEFESDSLVAKLLLKKRHEKDLLVENPINYISVAHDKTKISYLTHDRIEKLEPTQYWSSSRRFAARPGTFISKIFKDISGKEVEKFSNLYRSHSNKPEFTFKIVEGGEILKYYHVTSYAEERGTLGASCMKYDSCQNYLGLYTDNSDVVKMLVMLNSDNRLIGRALLWSFDDNKIMDRIYTIADEEFLFQFKKWATDNGFLYKSEQNWYNTLNFENLSTPKKEIKLEVTLKNSEFRRYPYVDTFKFLDSNSKLLNYLPEDSHKTLTSSDGGYNGSNCLLFDDIDRVLRHHGDCVNLRYLNNIRTHHNNARYSEINDQYILEKDCKFDEDIEEYIFIEEYDKFNNIERINEKRDYIQKRREGQKSRKKSSLSFIESLIGNDLSNDVINQVYQRITERTGIPRSYFVYTPEDESTISENEQTEPQTESVE
jgi:hypothetical protein